ncbi:MAG TPA: hypothetical protein VG895_04840 [Patescibacteria group bacterium]|nr:hypothetical protein [Patescibacteria group bacterium]
MTTESQEQTKRNPLDIMLEIQREVYPLPQPPENAPWLNKLSEELTDTDKKARWNFVMEVQTAIANTPMWIPSDHPRYYEYESARRDYESWFRLSPKDLLIEFNI